MVAANTACWSMRKVPFEYSYAEINDDLDYVDLAKYEQSLQLTTGYKKLIE